MKSTNTKVSWKPEDFDNHTSQESTAKVDQKLSKCWNDEAKKCKPNILKAIFATFIYDFTLLTGILVIRECLGDVLYIYSGISLISAIREYSYQSINLSNSSSSIDHHHHNTGYLFDDFKKENLIGVAIILVVSCAISSLPMSLFTWKLSKVSEKIRTALVKIIYTKSMRINRSYEYKQVINLVCVDLERLDYNLSSVFRLIAGCIECALLTSLLAHQNGLLITSIAIGIAGIVSMSQVYLNYTLQKSIQNGLKLADARTQLVTETIRAIRVLRMFTWTKMMLNKIDAARAKEVEQKRFNIVASCIQNIVFFTIGGGTVILTLVVAHYFLPDLRITQTVISELFIITLVYRRCLSRHLPSGIISVINLRIMKERIGVYLVLPDKIKIEEHQAYKLDKSSNTILHLNDVTARWIDNNSKQNCLNRVNLVVNQGELVAVVGRVGSGKSSLLQAILGELSISEGSIKLRAGSTLSYASQNPWIFAGTIRENILFGSPFDAIRYTEVLRCCSLVPDLRAFPLLDGQLVGERGVILSGGQKARLNLARCLYSDADVYLIDDPLSAVDTHVAQQIFYRAFKGFLKDKTVILVTHQIQFLQHTDRILLLDQPGKLTTYQEVYPKEKLVLRENDVEKYSKTQSLVENEFLASVISRSQINSNTNTAERDILANLKTHSWSALKFYLKNAGSTKSYVTFIIFSLMIGYGYTAVIIWLSYWTRVHEFNENSFGQTWIEHINYEEAMLIGLMIWLVYLFLVIIRSIEYVKMHCLAVKRIHRKLMNSIIWANMRFHDTTSEGQLVSRISADIDFLDMNFFSLLQNIDSTSLSTTFILINMIVFEPKIVFIAGACISVILVIFQNKVGLLNAAESIESYRKGLVYSHISTTMDGLCTIRASRKESIFLEMLSDTQNNHSSAYHMGLRMKAKVSKWFNLTLLLFCSVMVFIYVNDTLNHGGTFAFIGLSFIQNLTRTGKNAFEHFIGLYSKLSSLTRLQEFSSIEREHKIIQEGEQSDEANFTSGKLEFIGVSLKYHPTSEIILKNVSFTLNAGEKLGIVGRTGAGKSSLISVLFNLYHFEGFILVDNQDTKQLTLDSLRRSISIIPQDPTLFSGSLRSNLDPWNEYSDETIWKSLEVVQLKNLIDEQKFGLELEVSAGGENFSVGQRQLVCLARAILRKTKILLLDEATANIDYETNVLIQKTVQKQFKDCTVITVAHRLSTIKNSDRIMVLENGKICEFGTQDELVKLGGLYTSMLGSSKF